MTDRRLRRLLLTGTAVLAALVLVAVLLPGGVRDWLAFFLHREMRPELFVLLMLLLPVFGCPISPFLLLVGLKFGALWGGVITAGILALHLLVCYGLTHSVLRPLVNRLLAGSDYRLPELREQRRIVFSLLFMAFPGLPYAVKNYALATLNVPLHIYFPVAWGINMILAVPFIGIGFSLTTDPRLAVIFVLVLVGGYGLACWLRRKHRRQGA